MTKMDINGNTALELLDLPDLAVVLAECDDGTILYAGGGVRRLFPDVDPEKAVGQKFGDVFSFSGEGASGLFPIRRNQDNKEGFSFRSVMGDRHFEIRIRLIDLEEEVIAACYIYDRTSQVRDLEKVRSRYHSQITMMSGVSPQALGTIRMNLTRNTYETPLGRVSKGLRDLRQRTVDELFDYACERCVTFEDEQAYGSVFVREKLQQSFLEGNTNRSLLHRYYLEDDMPIWITTAINMARNPDTGDIEAILYTVNSDREKTTALLLKAMAEKDYESVMLINTITGSAEDIYGVFRITGRQYREGRFPYPEEMTRYIKKRCVDANPDGIVKSLSINAVVRALLGRENYSVYYAVADGRGNVRHKKATFYKIDSMGSRICHTIQDVTEAFETEEMQKQQIRKALDEARKASEAKDMILMRMSHDVRTAVNSMMGLTAAARIDLHNEEALAGDLDGIGRSGAFLNDVIDDILSLRELERNHVHLSEEALVIRDLVQTLTSLVGTQMMSQKISFSVRCEMPEDRRILTDRIQLARIVMKILSNAMEHTPENGRISLVIGEQRISREKTTLILTVTDSGVGMSADKQKAIINGEMLRSADTASASFGLKIVRGYVEAMHGTLVIESEEGSGTSVRIEVPVGIVNEPARTSVSLPRTIRFRNGRVLLVDDHRLSLDIGRRMLERVNLTVETATNGQEAIKAFEEADGDFDVVLMDIRMPVMDGLEAAAAIRHLPVAGASSVPILAMSASAFEEDIRNSILAGMNEHIAKPIDPDALYQILAAYIPTEN